MREVSPSAQMRVLLDEPRPYNYLQMASCDYSGGRDSLPLPVDESAQDYCRWEGAPLSTSSLSLSLFFALATILILVLFKYSVCCYMLLHPPLSLALTVIVIVIAILLWTDDNT